MLDRFRGADDDLERVARKLGVSADPSQIEERIDELSEAADRLAAEAALSEELSNPPANDADGITKITSLADAVDRNVLSIDSRSNRPHGSPGHDRTIAAVADELNRRRTIRTRTGQRLLDELAGSRGGDRTTVVETLETVLDALERDEETRDRLDDGGDGIETVEDLVTAHDGTKRELIELQRRYERLSDATERLLVDLDAPVAGTSTTSSDGDSTGSGTERPPGNDEHLLSAIDRARVKAGRGANADVTDAVVDARETARPRSNQAQRLFQALEERERVDEQLIETARALDEAASVRALTNSADRTTAIGLCDRVSEQLSMVDSPLSSDLSERVSKLRSGVERADETNTVTPYAVTEELRFYDRQFVPALRDDAAMGTSSGREGATGVQGAVGRRADRDLDGSGGDEVRETITTLSEERQRIQTQYVSSRPDHNHSIPLFFLSLAGDLLDEAGQRVDRSAEQEAIGLCTGIEALLDHTEKLYTRNEYSVMLRSLRG